MYFVILSPFSQLPPSPSSNFQGLGLGFHESLEAISLGWEINGDSHRAQGFYSGLRRESRMF